MWVLTTTIIIIIIIITDQWVILVYGIGVPLQLLFKLFSGFYFFFLSFFSFYYFLILFSLLFIFLFLSFFHSFPETTPKQLEPQPSSPQDKNSLPVTRYFSYIIDRFIINFDIFLYIHLYVDINQFLYKLDPFCSHFPLFPSLPLSLSSRQIKKLRCV